MLNEDYKEMLQLLLEEQVNFIIVGAYALGTHGYPRATGDIDIWVKPNEINSKKLYKALARFGAPLGQIVWIVGRSLIIQLCQEIGDEFSRRRIFSGEGRINRKKSNYSLERLIAKF